MNDIIFLLHGLGRSSWSMKRPEWWLARQGYTVFNLNYPSQKFAVKELAQWVDEKVALHNHDPERKIHFVTHSLGSIVLRCWAKERRTTNFGRAVMLCPPNQGTELVDIFQRFALFRHMSGKAGRQLSTAPESVPNTLGPVNFDAGIIAGNRSINPGLSLLLPGEDDGRIPVERMKVAGMRDFIVLPYSHPLIMNYSATLKQVGHFLEHGEFQK